MQGSIRPEATAVFALDAIRDAFAEVLKREHIGHVAVVMDGEARRLGLG